MSETLHFSNVNVFTGTELLPSQSVLVSDGLIAAVGTGLSVPPDAVSLDGTGRTLLPGLIDSHTHILGPALTNALRFGVTTELDMANSLELLRPAFAAQDDPDCPVADLRSAGAAATVPGGHGTSYLPDVPTITEPAEAPAFVAARRAEGSSYLKIHYEDGQITSRLAGHPVPVISLPTLTALAAAARAAGMLCLVHVGTQRAAGEAIQAGVNGLAHIFFDEEPDADFGRFAAEHGVFIVPTLTTIELTAGRSEIGGLADDPELAPYLPAADLSLLQRHQRAQAPQLPVNLDHARAAVRLAAGAGVPILAGTDAVLALHGSGMHRELELLVQSGLTPAQALTAATATPARIFGLTDRGRIEAGLRADLVLVRDDPTHDIRASRRIELILKRGRIMDRQAPAPAWAAFPPGLAEHEPAAVGHGS